MYTASDRIHKLIEPYTLRTHPAVYSYSRSFLIYIEKQYSQILQ